MYPGHHFRIVPIPNETRRVNDLYHIFRRKFFMFPNITVLPDVRYYNNFRGISQQIILNYTSSLQMPEGLILRPPNRFASIYLQNAALIYRT